MGLSQNFFLLHPFYFLLRLAVRLIYRKLLHDYQQASLIHNISFEDNQIVYEVRKKKENKAQFLNEIINIYNEIETGKCIIYCPSVKGCENLIIELQTKISKEIIAMYHGELSAKQKPAVLFDWKSGKIRIMIVTNAFGMGINVPDVRIVIHTGFPMSISKLKKIISLYNIS
jgi:superfamily II DNA helicase RecQ